MFLFTAPAAHPLPARLCACLEEEIHRTILCAAEGANHAIHMIFVPSVVCFPPSRHRTHMPGILSSSDSYY